MPVALITGAGSGIGRALALLLAGEGYQIAGIDLHHEGLASLAEEMKRAGQSLEWRVADVTESASLKAAVADLETRLGPVDLLIASAGIGIETSGLRYSAEDFARVIDVNLIGVSNSIGAVLPGMLERGRGHLVGLSSVASFRGLPRMLGYCASKAGLNALFEGLRVEVESRGVAVTIVCPGWVRTPMTAQIDGPLEHILEPEEAARQILHAIRRKAPFHVFPPAMHRRMRFLMWLPRRWQDAYLRKMMRQLRPRARG